MRILITGAQGMLGRDVAEVAERKEHEVVALGRSELDITDLEAVRAAFAEHKPEVVINCAAWTDVDGAEEAEAAATEVNGAGAGNVARASAECGAFVVQVSSDYVFDGRAGIPYEETARTNPISAYGRSKLAGEIAVAQGAPEAHAIVRSSWLFGLHGRNFVDTMVSLGETTPELRVVDDQIGCPTWTRHLAYGLIDVAVRRVGGVLHVAGSGNCSWFDLASRAITEARLDCTVTPVTTAEFPRPAVRPEFSALGSTRQDAPVLPRWQDGVSGYLKLRTAAKAEAR